MAGEAGARPLLPQTSPLNYSFVQQSQPPRDQPRNYVFVDEHNRHKRLKVMRACDGCRKRKIKCDAATTNTWPCGSCTRLKLTCVPPTVNYENDSEPFEVNPPQQYRTVDHVQIYPPSIPSAPTASSVQPADQGVNAFATPFSSFQPQQYLDLSPSQPPLSSYNPVVSASVTDDQYDFAQHGSFDATYQHPAGDLAWNGSEVSTDNLADAMGTLSIDHTGVAPYIMAQKRSLASSHAVEEYEADLPPTVQSSDFAVRIPPEMFPSDQLALKYFKYFFDNVHPYCPVISREHFYNQWHTSKESISTLLLEAIFACSAMALDGHQTGTKWLALASKHEDSFKDVARLSTVQAMIILLKAREAVPKRGYYYRSWMTVVNSVLMCQDLEINDHLDLHRQGLTCNAPAYECAEKQRVWHMLFVLEIMVGGPQARHDFRVEADTCDFSVPTFIAGFDETEVEISRQFAYMMQIAKNVKETNLLWYTLSRQKKDWGVDPRFTGHNQDYENWLRDLPRSLQINLPSDGAQPWVPSHFIGQLHSYHYLSIVMHHRPQIHFLSDAGDPSWRSHMLLCYRSAKNMCRIQEAMVNRYGLKALSCMQRGISFTVYAILTCTMVHLAAITAPDPELNSDAPDFFSRHMRLLEQCMQNWDMPEMQMQIDGLREAFSADTSKPFELKSSFPQGSPPAARSSQSPHFSSSDSPFGGMPEPATTIQPPTDSPTGQVLPTAYVQPIIHPITPPISITDSEPKTDSPIGQSLVNMPTGSLLPGQQRLATTSAGVAAEQQAWNPTRIFDQWDVAFTPAPPQPPQQSPPPMGGNPGAPFNPRSDPSDASTSTFASQASQSAQAAFYNTHMGGGAANQAAYQPQLFSPGQWKDLVSSSFSDGGLKRRWDNAYGVDLGGGMAKRSR